MPSAAGSTVQVNRRGGERARGVLRSDGDGAGARGRRRPGDQAAGRRDRGSGRQAGRRVGQRLARDGVAGADRDGYRRAGQAFLGDRGGDRDRLAKLGRADGQRPGQRPVRVRVTDRDAVAAGRGRPGAGRGIPVLQVALGELEGDGLTGTRLETDAGEAFKLSWRLARR
jgi:hypothetical protein